MRGGVRKRTVQGGGATVGREEGKGTRMGKNIH